MTLPSLVLLLEHPTLVLRPWLGARCLANSLSALFALYMLLLNEELVGIIPIRSSITINLYLRDQSQFTLLINIIVNSKHTTINIKIQNSVGPKHAVDLCNTLSDFILTDLIPQR